MRTRAIIIGGALLLLVALTGAWAWHQNPLATHKQPSTASETASSTANTNAAEAISAAPTFFPLDAADTISSWSFRSLDTGNASVSAATDADTAKLTALLGTGQYDDYDLYIGIGNDAVLRGDGTAALDAYDHAIAIHPGKGLAYANLGHLFDELSAYHTAANAYKKAVTVEPAILQYHLSRLDFLTKRFPADGAQLAAAFKSAHDQFGDTASILSIKAEWLESEGRYADAVAAWQTVRALSPESRQAAIDAQITRDRLKAAQ